MTDDELAHPHDLLVRRFLIEPELMSDLLAYYVKQDADKEMIRLINLANLRCESPVNIDKNLVEVLVICGSQRISKQTNDNQTFSCFSNINRRLTNEFGFAD